MAFIGIATVFLANNAAITQQQSAAVRDNQADFQRRSGIQIARSPYRPFIERRNGQQLINFDLFVKNVGTKKYNLVSIKLKVFDSDDRLELGRELNENGRPPALDMIGERLLQPGKVLDVFQPFYAFDAAVDVHRMHFELLFMKEGHAVPPAAITADECRRILHQHGEQGAGMRPTLFLRIASGMTLIHAAMHTVGGVFGKVNPGPASVAWDAMKANQFLLMGHMRSFFDFCRGLGLCVTIALTAEGIVF